MLNQQAQGVGSPISNDVYNVIAALATKLEGLEAYRKYQQDGNSQLWQQLASLDNQCVQLLTQELGRLAQSGRLQPMRPGQSVAGQSGQSVPTA
jgi:hypothetical protein